MSPNSLHYVLYERFLLGARVYREDDFIMFSYSRVPGFEVLRCVTYNLTLDLNHPLSPMAFVYRYANV